MPAGRTPLLLALVLGVLTVFGPSLGAQFVWDDNPLIRDNAEVHSLGGLAQAWTGDFWHTSDPATSQHSGFYRPLVKSAFVLEWALFAGAPAGFHAVNLLLHLACCLLAFGWIRRRLGGDPDDRRAQLAAGVGAALFALHPSRVESVAWISGSTDLWMTLFLLLALWRWDTRRGARDVWLAGALLSLAILCKEAAILAPVAIAADLAIAGKLRTGRLKLLWLGALPLLTAAVRSRIIPPRYVPVLGLGTGDLLRRVAASFGRLVELAVVPGAPSVLSGAPPSVDGHFVLPQHWLVVGALAALALAAVAGMALRWPRWRPALGDLTWFVVPLLPTLNVVPLGYRMLVSDRFLYWPLLGLAALLARAVLVAQARLRPAWIAAPVLAGLALLAWLTADAVPHFASDAALWAHERERHPDDPYAADLLARARWAEGDSSLPVQQAALAALRGADDEDLRARSAVLWAVIHAAAASDLDAAALRESAAVLDAVDAGGGTVPIAGRQERLRPTPGGRQRLAASLSFALDRAVLHARLGLLAEAEAQLRTLLATAPDRPAVRLNLARVLAWEQRWDEARAALDPLEDGSPAKQHLAGQLDAGRTLAQVSGPLAPVRALLAVAGAGEAYRRASALIPAEPQAAVLAVEACVQAGADHCADRVISEVPSTGPQRRQLEEAERSLRSAS